MHSHCKASAAPLPRTYSLTSRLTPLCALGFCHRPLSGLLCPQLSDDLWSFCSLTGYHLPSMLVQGPSLPSSAMSYLTFMVIPHVRLVLRS